MSHILCIFPIKITILLFSKIKPIKCLRDIIIIMLNTLPFDLIRELCCYFNYPTTSDLIAICNINNADEIWKYKIINELKYDLDKTLLPLDQKYLQIKARDDVDAGCEIFVNDISLMYYRASKKSDPIERQNLLDYFQNLPIIQSMEEIRSCEISILVGALEADNKELIDEYKHYLTIDKNLFDSEIIKLVNISNKSSYYKDLLKLTESIHIINDKDLINIYNDFFSQYYVGHDAFNVSVRVAHKGLVLSLSDNQMLEYIDKHNKTNETSIKSWSYLYMALLENRKYKIADYLYDLKLKFIDKSMLEPRDHIEVAVVLLLTDNVKYIKLIEEWLLSSSTNIILLILSNYAIENNHKIYNLKNLDLIYDLYFRRLENELRIYTMLNAVVCNALKCGALDFVEWLKSKGLSIDNVQMKKLENSIRKDKSKIYPEFVLNYIKQFQ